MVIDLSISFCRSFILQFFWIFRCLENLFFNLENLLFFIEILSMDNMIAVWAQLANWAFSGGSSNDQSALHDNWFEKCRVQRFVTGKILDLCIHLWLQIFWEPRGFIALALGFLEQNLLYIDRADRVDSILDGYELLIDWFMVGFECLLLKVSRKNILID